MKSLESVGSDGVYTATDPTRIRLDPLAFSAEGRNQVEYLCVLIPRNSQHYLAGELSEKVSIWVQQVCQEMDWRLEGISLRPNYLQWTVLVDPSIHPDTIVKVVRMRTSGFIYSHFSKLNEQNPTGDFWADRHLVVSGAQLPSAQLLRECIAQARLQMLDVPQASTP
jgi:REP element-mobilizing transposase RayT